jgi:uncharacterized protein (TIGR02118 family)
MHYATVLYPNREGVKFDFDYYLKKHVPMVGQLLGCAIDICKGVGTPAGGPPAFICIARIEVKSLESFQAAMATHGLQILGDVPNYTNIQPVVQIDELVLDMAMRPAV